MFKQLLPIKKYLQPKNFQELVIGYVVFCTLLSTFIPENINLHEIIHPLTTMMGKVFPGIESLARQSKTPLAIRAYYSIQWMLFPYILYSSFGLLTPKTTSKNIFELSKTKKFQLVLYMIFMLCISTLGFYLLAFHVHTTQYGFDSMPPGRGEALAIALTNKYTAGLFSSILHLTVVILFTASILMARGIFNRPSN